ncbi:hypothetical protein THASP1DRAFT_32667 [Thamnocephalis sphaerospora]|uniref:Beta-catenin-like protein 1 N-terminal domain-containing protein n=1 Tax=Thamnocephalis sphaerospora TaxID=78915 RepID=A0A4P9XIG7_9FUNG|nr:hypothetical protein THASP1DRAFT_32667 [Thamnocephalis sphaerospora]|eukprot:RKP05493.1 hypothetical protein THASP1DRAFT_32667 [Thamnocephalis sphaerospora]
MCTNVQAYKRRDPEDADAEEHVENLFNTLCSVLLEPIGRQAFVEAEGIELMLILLKERRFARLRALKVISHAVSGHDATSTASCTRLVEARGLGPLFSAFMQKGNRKYKKEYKSFSETEDEEHTAAILAALFRSLPTSLAGVAGNQGAALSTRDRLLFKFMENDMEKLDRLLELRDSWWIKVAAVDADIDARRRRLLKRSHDRISHEDESDEDDEDDDTELHPDVIYLRRLEAGLFTVQMVDLVIAQLCTLDTSVQQHVSMILRRSGRSIEDVCVDVAEYASAIGDEETGGDAEVDLLARERSQQERARALKLARRLARLCKADGKRPSTSEVAS